MHCTNTDPLDFMESVLAKALAEAKSSFSLEGSLLEISDVASTRGLMPFFLGVIQIQSAVCRSALPEEEYGFLFGWLEDFSLVSDPATLTGRRVACREFQFNEGSRYTLPASVLLAVDRVMECSPTPGLVDFNLFREEILYDSTEPRPR